VAVLIKPTQQSSNACLGKSYAGIGGAVVHANGVSVFRRRESTGKHNVVNVANPFIFGLGSEYPGVTSQQALFRAIDIEKSQSQPVK
jgi:hypothetical protein